MPQRNADCTEVCWEAAVVLSQYCTGMHSSVCRAFVGTAGLLWHLLAGTVPNCMSAESFAFILNTEIVLG